MSYRNNKLLEAARDCPMCMSCRKRNDGTVVAAHSNQLRDGKGTGHKAHDYRVAYLCSACHFDIDQGSAWDRATKRSVWEEAHRATIGYLFEEGIVK